MAKIVSDFITNTCRQHPTPSIKKFYALYFRMKLTAYVPDDDHYEPIAITSGSASEFYIESMLPCIGDIDIMYHRNDWLAIPAGHPVPRYLPADFRREVSVYELVDDEFPCYMLVRRVCKLTKCDNSSSYRRAATEEAYASTTTSGA